MSEEKVKRRALRNFALLLLSWAFFLFLGAYAVKKGPVFKECISQCVEDKLLKPVNE